MQQIAFMRENLVIYFVVGYTRMEEIDRPAYLLIKNRGVCDKYVLSLNDQLRKQSEESL
ncbi:hypothetical protein KTT_44140 [Tengunoibacter tsumagoiensis]|uniref:Uncharacterized protein n=1 Tax=Tengunoibacter tsumagoiensis TaxID=2014871 RepID=A0A402A6B3_9CHLR|nr:hypothetical protein KTT_44140 [Tengunoibacter tsumagoiensis]